MALRALFGAQQHIVMQAVCQVHLDSNVSYASLAESLVKLVYAELH